MITTIDIMNEIQAMIAKEIHDVVEVYIDLVPNEFERPSILIEAISTQITPANMRTLHVVEDISITIIHEIDEYDHVKTRQLLKMRDDVMHLFLNGYIKVSNRAISVNISEDGRNWGEAYLNLEFEYYDMKPSEKVEMPLMENVEVVMNKKG